MKCDACNAKLVFVRGGWVCSKEFSEYIAKSSNFVRYGRYRGVIIGVSCGEFEVAVHNGMKIRHNRVPIEKTRQISREEIVKYCTEKGQTSTLELINKF